LIRLFPGFPLPDADYQELVTLLEIGGGPEQTILVAHSRGALDALASDAFPGAPLFLLAPSVPRRRRGTPFLRSALRTAGGIPIMRDVLARRFREATYRRYGAETPSGPPLELAAAAQRLRPTPSAAASPDSRAVVVITSSDDLRHADQVLLATRLGATVLHHPGGHLFPITHAVSTAHTIRTALASGLTTPPGVDQ
jgi:hypothetical protein